MTYSVSFIQGLFSDLSNRKYLFKIEIKYYNNYCVIQISFYEPTPTRHKILLESKAFPSDHVSLFQLLINWHIFSVPS